MDSMLQFEPRNKYLDDKALIRAPVIEETRLHTRSWAMLLGGSRSYQLCSM